MMGINFFSPILENDCKLKSLISYITGVTIDSSAIVTSKVFEKKPDGNKHTNFDFFFALDNGQKFYFEIKYTESEFGGIKPDEKYPERYTKEWKIFYEQQIRSSKHLSNFDDASFFSDYQINRNIAYVTREYFENEYVCFLYPFENGSLSRELNSIDFDHILKIDWKFAAESAVKLFKDDTLIFKHYSEFVEKYICF